MGHNAHTLSQNAALVLNCTAGRGACSAAPHICFSSHPPLLACRSAAPTGDGKSLVAEVVMLRALAAEKSRGPGVARKAMLVRRLGWRRWKCVHHK